MYIISSSEYLDDAVQFYCESLDRLLRSIETQSDTLKNAIYKDSTTLLTGNIEVNHLSDNIKEVSLYYVWDFDEEGEVEEVTVYLIPLKPL